LKVEKLLKQFRPVSLPCFNFVDEDDNRRKVSAIIVPIGFEEKNGKLIVSWACNLGLKCQEKACRYSKASQSSSFPVATP
jgi:hypothetical protein